MVQGQPSSEPHTPPESFTGIADLGKIMSSAVIHAATAPDYVVGRHYTRQLDRPASFGSYGTFHERLDYLGGCTLESQLEHSAGVISWKATRDDGQEYSVVIGQTPAALDPRKGGRTVENAGDAQDFLLQKRVTGDKDNPVARYLSLAEIAGVVVVPGADVTFSRDADRRHHLNMPGVVNEVAGYR